MEDSFYTMSIVIIFPEKPEMHVEVEDRENGNTLSFPTQIFFFLNLTT